MLEDLQDIGSGARIDCDLCIVGAGAAGLTLARAFRGAGIRVVLLESGGLDFEPEVHDAGAGRNIGMPYYDLSNSRLRFLGGTTNIWGGRCTPMNEIDFEHRPWVPHSGWPIGEAELWAGYQRAHGDLEIGPYDYGDGLWASMGTRPPAFDPDALTYGYWRFDPVKDRFNASRCSDLFAAADVRVITHATVTHIEVSSDADQVNFLSTRGPHAGDARVAAGTYVLACGGIENARLLLASRNVEPNGIGNRHDQVGRYFMEHPHGRLGIIHGTRSHELWNRLRSRFPKDSVPLAPALRAAPGMQHERHMLNTALTFKLQKDPRAGLGMGKRLYHQLKHQLNPTRGNRLAWYGYRRLAAAYQRRLRPALERVLARLPGRVLSVMIRAEQAPNPRSRVVLSRQLDHFGAPRADLDWQLSPIDKHTVRQLAELLDQELRRLELGRLAVEPWLSEDGPQWPLDPTVGNHPIGGYHHMGTTRMSRDPRHGVVNSDCRVHGYTNLYIAGSSVFPTSGWANPTLTILALAHRLHEHLRARHMAGPRRAP